MKSRTSFFNLTAFRKNITRFAPVWALYTVFLLLVLFAVNEQEPLYMARDVLAITRLAGVGNLLYAGIVAMCLFGDLYKNRLCCALHAFPMRREGWLLTNVATGFLFSFVPNALVCVFASFSLGEYAYLIWILFGISCLQYLFFFGTAVLSAMCAGNQLGMVAIYGIIHFVVVLIYFLAEVIYQPLIYGIELHTDKFFRYFPLSRMFTEYVNTEYKKIALVFLGYDKEAWTHLAICAAVGVVSFVLAWVVYRRRHLERAGDFISLRPVAPVFLVIYTIAVGTVFYSFSEMINQPSYMVFAAGIAIGFFTGQMLLNRTVRVFHKKSWLAFGVLAVVLSGSMALTWLDPMGIGSYVPPLNKVESAAIYGPDKIYYYAYDPDEYNTFELTDPEEISKLQTFHQKLAANRPAGNNTYDVRIRYKLTDGSEVSRYYQVNINGSLAEEAGAWFSDARYIFQLEDPEVLYHLFDAFNVDQHYYDPNTGDWEPFFYKSKDPEELKGLLDAILADCAAGKMGQFWNFHRGEEIKYNIGFELKDDFSEKNDEAYRFKTLSVYNDSTNTIAYLDKLFADLPDDYNDQIG